eukprot:TRINITY_DN33_c0_g1_i4.p1 TRINITY_DN33_c0_g1~~TRINITY_DN33_c0_g1_i4.p1  ORF type:complete len:284 (+),score=36.42 TRINITY_DN33_c0_g1_i4:252-1103(+)
MAAAAATTASNMAASIRPLAAARSSTSTSTSASTSNSAFVTGNRELRSVAGPGFAMSNGSKLVMKTVGTRRVSAKGPYEKKSWLPIVKNNPIVDPEWLDASLAGDYGFDPLGLGKDPALLKWYREAEIIHGRWAMTAVVGILIGQAVSGIPWFQAGAEPSAVAPFSFGSLLGTQLLLMGWVEGKRWADFVNPGSQSVWWATPWSKTSENFVNTTGQQGYPGGQFFDPLRLAGSISGGKYNVDFDKLPRLQTAEIKHARLAMVAMLIFYFEAGQGLTPLQALGF